MTRLWHSRVQISQIPAIIEEEIIHASHDSKTSIKKTWMYDIFSDYSVNGLEVLCNENFSMTFVKQADSLEDARTKSIFLLNSLEYKFPGITGVPSQVPIRAANIDKIRCLYEILLPHPIFNSILLFQKIIHLFMKLKDISVGLYFFWQRKKPENRYPEGSIYNDNEKKYDNYRVKIFVAHVENESSSKIEPQIDAEFDMYVNLLVFGLTNSFNQRMTLARMPLENTWTRMLMFRILEDNIAEQIDYKKYYLRPDQGDFTFLNELPIPKGYVLEKESVNFLDHNPMNRQRVEIGRYISKGVPSNKKISIAISDFSQSAVIFGQPGTGKTYFLGNLSREFHQKAEDIGILYLNLGKGNQEKLYSVDKVIKYGSEKLRIPYYIIGKPFYRVKTLQETATYLISSLGLKDPVDKILFIVMNSFIGTNGQLPDSLEELFRGLKKWYKEYKYHVEYQTNILRAIENRILSLLSDPILDKTLALLQYPKIPEWFEEWRIGKKIYIDLSMCNIYVKRLLANSIFQMVRTLTPDMDVEGLRNIIVVDEAHQILEKPVINNPNDDDYIAREQLEKIFNVLLKEFRGKGLAFILADQTPHLLFNCVSALPSLKILFRLGYQSSKLFSNNLNELDFIMFQKNREALIFNGVNAEKFAFETLRYSPTIPSLKWKIIKKGVTIQDE